MREEKILLIFTGGTISMGENSENHSLAPLSKDQVLNLLPELKMLGVHIETIAFHPLIDSSDIEPSHWVQIAHIIEDNYAQYDGFVVLHGTDTMAYSASALSFMLNGLEKPVIFTGSQLPVGVLRSDAKENLITAIELAAAQDENGKAIVPEVSLFFEGKLMRGNRTTKRNSEDFNAFASFNYPELARTGVHIKYYPHYIHKREENEKFSVEYEYDNNVVILKLYPGIQPHVVESIYNIEGLKGVVLESYGSGNAPTSPWLSKIIAEATARKILTVNVTQCRAGGVEQGRYAASVGLLDAGVVFCSDMTVESAVTKLMLCFGKYKNFDEAVEQMRHPWRGECSY